MNEKNQLNSQWPQFSRKALIVAVGLALTVAPLIQSAGAAEHRAKANKTAVATVAEPGGAIEFSPQINTSLGKSTLLKLPSAASRISVGDKDIADVILINPKEVYLLGKKVGSTNIMLWSKSGQSTVVDVNVSMDAGALQGKLQQLLPDEKGIRVSNAADTLILTGTVSDAMKVDKAMMVAEAYAGKKVVNMLNVSAPQQVMLEVKMAEVSKTLLDKLGAQFSASKIGGPGGITYAIASGFLSLAAAGTASGGGLLQLTHGSTKINIDAEDKDAILKILAEPNIMAISGQEGSFLAGGKFFIPVTQGGLGGVTLEEREFGVGLKFTPTVLEGDLINLRVSPEVSELAKSEDVSGTTVSTLPSLLTRRVSTTVQLHDGQSFAIAGLIKNNVTTSIRRFPVLGNIPILGALFRSSAFQTDKTELMFVVTPRLVKPLPANYALPTDNYVPPTKSEFFLNGKLEGKPGTPDKATVEPDKAAKDQPGATSPAPKSDSSGYEMK